MTPPTADMRETMTTSELVTKCRAWISDLCNGKRKWMMRIPAEPDYDPDLLWATMCDRLEAADKEREELKRLLRWAWPLATGEAQYANRIDGKWVPFIPDCPDKRRIEEIVNG